MAKLLLVQEKGIGEDLPTTIVGWESHKVNVLAQAGERIRHKPLDERYRRLTLVAREVMNGWCPDEFTLISEGFCNVGSEDEQRPLSEAFVDNPDVRECLTFVHVTTRLKPLVIAVPYKCGLGRTTAFDGPSRAYSADFAEQWEPLVDALTYHPQDVADAAKAGREIELLGWSLPDDAFG